MPGIFRPPLSPPRVPAGRGDVAPDLYVASPYVFVCGGECSNLAHWSTVQTGVVSDTGTVRSGSRSIKVPAVGAPMYAEYLLPSGQSVVVARFSIYLSSLPVADAEFWSTRTATTVQNAILGYDSATGKLAVWEQSAFASRVLGPVIPVNTWTTIDLMIDARTAPSPTITWRVNDTNQTTFQGATGVTGVWDTGVFFGQSTATGHLADTTYTAYFDDIVASFDPATYPIGGGAAFGSPETWHPSSVTFNAAALSIGGGPWAYWRFGEPSGATSTDDQGHATGAYQASPTLGAASLISGDPNTAVSFNGTTQYMKVASFTATNVDFLSFFVAINIAALTGGVDNTLVGHGTNGFYLALKSDGTLTLNKSNVAELVHSTITLGLATTYRIYVTKHGSVNRIWVNGIDVTGAQLNTGTYTVNFTELAIGADRDGSTPFHGTMDEPIFWDGYELTDADVQLLEASVGNRPSGTLNNRTASDTTSLSEAVARPATTFNRTATDTVTTSESASRAAISHARTATDTTSISSDTANGVKNFVRSATDTTSQSDSVSRAAASKTRTATDTTSLSDSVSRAAIVFSRTATDTTAVSESANSIDSHPRAISETLTTSESVSRSAIVFTRTATDTTSLSESASGIKSFGRSATDTTSVSESVSRAAASKTRTLTDTTSLSESVTRSGISFTRSASDTTTVTDAVARAAGTFTRSLSDTTSASESVSRAGIVFSRTTSDTTSVSEAVARASVLESRTVADTTNTTDSIARAAIIFARSTTDTTSLSESVTRGAISQSRTATDSVTTSESITRLDSDTRAASDTTSITESVSRSAITFSRSATDTTSVSESAAGGKLFTRALTDTTSVTESVARAAISHARTVTDTTTVSETATRAGNLHSRTCVDSISPGFFDSVARAAISHARTASDTTTTSSSISRIANKARTASDTTSVSDSPTYTSLLTRSASDSVALPTFSSTPATSDDFTRVVSGGGIGGAWSTVYEGGSVSVDGSRIQLATGSVGQYTIGPTLDEDTGAVRMLIRWNSSGNEYPGGSPNVVLALGNWGGQTFFSFGSEWFITASEGDPVDLGPAAPEYGLDHWFEVEVFVDTIRARTWRVGDAVPDWQAIGSRSIVLGNGLVPLAIQVGADQDVASYDDFSAYALQSLGASETLTRAPIVYARTATDTTSVSDSVINLGTGARLASDTTTVSESVSRVFTGSRSAADTTSVSEAVTRSGIVYVRTATDTTSVSESVSRAAIAFARTAADTTSVSESANRTIRWLRSVADTTTLSDAAQRIAAFGRTASDTTSSSDSIATAGAGSKTATDSLTTSDSLTRAPIVHSRTASDSTSVSESVGGGNLVTRSVTDTTSVTDSVTRGAVTWVRTTADVTAVTEHATRSGISFVRSSTDVTSVSDSPTYSAGSGRSLVDTTSVTDAVSRTGVFIRRATEFTTVSDQVGGAATVTPIHGGVGAAYRRPKLGVTSHPGSLGAVTRGRTMGTSRSTGHLGAKYRVKVPLGAKEE